MIIYLRNHKAIALNHYENLTGIGKLFMLYIRLMFKFINLKHFFVLYTFFMITIKVFVT